MPVAFTGRWWDAESRLYQYRARWYDPHTGEFLSPDPIQDDFNNTYRYVGNGPTNGTDPSGLATDYEAFRGFAKAWGFDGLLQIHHKIPQTFFDSTSQYGKEFSKWLGDIGIGMDEARNLIPLANKAGVLEGVGGNARAMHLGGPTDKSLDRVAEQLKDVKTLNLTAEESAAMVRGIQQKETKFLRETRAALHTTETVAKVEAEAFAKAAKSGSKLGKAAKFLGPVATVALWGLAVQQKGSIAGTIDTGADSIPVVGWVKLGIELAAGEDLITADGVNLSVFHKAVANTVVSVWDGYWDFQYRQHQRSIRDVDDGVPYNGDFYLSNECWTGNIVDRNHNNIEWINSRIYVGCANFRYVQPDGYVESHIPPNEHGYVDTRWTVTEMLRSREPDENGNYWLRANLICPQGGYRKSDSWPILGTVTVAGVTNDAYLSRPTWGQLQVFAKWEGYYFGGLGASPIRRKSFGPIMLDPRAE